MIDCVTSSGVVVSNLQAKTNFRYLTHYGLSSIGVDLLRADAQHC